MRITVSGRTMTNTLSCIKVSGFYPAQAELFKKSSCIIYLFVFKIFLPNILCLVAVLWPYTGCTKKRVLNMMMCDKKLLEFQCLSLS